MMQAGLDFIACSLFPQSQPRMVINSVAVLVRSSIWPAVDITPSTALSTIDTLTLAATCRPDSVSARVPSLAARPPSDRCSRRSLHFH